MKKTILGAAALVIALSLAACGESEDSAPQVTKSPDAAASSAAEADSSPADESSADDSAPAESAADDSTAEVGTSLQPIVDELLAAYPDTLTGSVVYGTSVFEKNCKKLYACEPDELKDAAIVFNNGGGLADEISIVYPEDGDTDRLLRMFEARKESRYNDFNGYAPDELPKIEDGRTFTAGGAAVLVISDSADDIEQLIKEKLG